MSFRSFSPFASNASTNTRSEYGCSARPPTYTSNAIPAPTYLSNESISGAHSRSESVRAWSTSLPSVWSVADSDTVIDPTESALKDTASVTESSVEIAGPAGPRYVYYLVYAKDGAIATVNPVCSDDPYLGRISARRVAPPHTAGSLRHCLSSVENVGVNHHTSLFIATSRYTPNEPLALVVNSSRAAMFRTAFPVANRGRQCPTRHIYYRLYAEDGAIPMVKPVYSDDPYLGRILATLVAPPHTASSLRRCLSSIENISANIQTSLFIATSSESPMDDSDRMSILAHSGPGYTTSEPVALVCNIPCASVPRPLCPHESLAGRGSKPFKTRYLYYQVYKDNVGIKSKQPHPDDPYVGHISVDFVSPPHTAKSIILCISKSEDIHDCTQSQLFTGISSDSSIGEGHVSIFTSDRPGSTPEDPLAFVTVDLPFAKFTKRMRVTCAFTPSNFQRYLTVTKGEILRTTQDPPNPLGYYQAINGAGERGLVLACILEPVDHDAAWCRVISF